MVYSSIVTNDHELQQILHLQKLNLKQNISIDEKESQGFVTMPFTMEMLKAMHELAPSVIVKDDDKVIAYAIVFLKEGRKLYPNLEPMFVNFEKITWKEKPLNSYNFYVMGQICVAKEYRGGKVFDMLYEKHKEIYNNKFDFIITEISTSNYRSLRAHERVGFETVCVHRDHLDEWAVVLWNFQV